MARLRVSLVLLMCLVAKAGHAVEGDAILDALAKAKTTYAEELAAFRAAAAAHFDKREETVRKTGKKAAVDQVKAERKEFQERGEMSKAFPAALKADLRNARAAMETAYKAAISELVKMKRDDEATKIDDELREFMQTVPTGFSEPRRIKFVKGTTMDGEFRSGESTANGIVGVSPWMTWRLQVTEVKGEAFTGIWTWAEGEYIQTIEGKLGENGSVSVRYLQNLKGNDAAVDGGHWEGEISADGKILGSYARPSGNRIGEIKGKLGKSN